MDLFCDISAITPRECLLRDLANQETPQPPEDGFSTIDNNTETNDLIDMDNSTVNSTINSTDNQTDNTSV